MRTKLKLSNHTRKNGYKLVELYYFNQGKPVVLDTDVHVLEKFFDEAAVMKISSKVQTHIEDNAKLAEKEKRLKKIITEWQKRMVEDFGEEYGELYPPADYIKQAWKKPERDFANEEDVKEVFHTWIEGNSKKGIVGKKNKVKEVSIYRTVLGDIKKLYKNRKLTFREINEDFFQRLLSYWISKKPRIENSTINKRLTCLKIFLREEKKNKYNFYLSFKSGLSGVSNQPVIIPTEPEFQQLVNAESALNIPQLPEELDRARDYFVIGCSTSLRYSDIVRLTPANIVTINGEECIMTFIQKTTTPKHIIPLNAVSKFFLEKQFKANKYRCIKYMSNWKVNEQLHVLFQKLGFNTLETVIYKYGSTPTTVLTPKWQAMSMHASRAYFISRCVNSNQVSLGSTMNWSNHSNIKVVQRYIHKGFQQVQQMQELFATVTLPPTLLEMREAKLNQINNIANSNTLAK